MTAKAEQLKADLAVLPSSARAALARFLIESLDPDEDEGAEAEWDGAMAYYELEEKRLGLDKRSVIFYATRRR